MGALTATSLGADDGLTRLYPGDSERTAILNTARDKVAEDLKISDPSDIVFYVNKTGEYPHLCVAHDWALVDLTSGRTRGGRWEELPFKCTLDDVGFDVVTLLLMHKQDGNWTVSRGGVTCASDVFWLEWQADPELAVSASLFECLSPSVE